MAATVITVQPPNVVIAVNADGNAFTTITVTPPPLSVDFEAPGFPGTEYDAVGNFVASGVSATIAAAGSGSGGGGGGSSEGGGGA